MIPDVCACSRTSRLNDGCTGYQFVTSGKRKLFKLLSFSVLWLAVLPLFAQSATKLRVMTAPGVTQNQKPNDWHNTFGVSNGKLILTCPKCLPIQTVSLDKSEIATLRYGQNAYHHWAAGIATGIFTLGGGLIIGLMPHHQHFFSVDLKNGRAVGIQADKGDYKEIASMLINYTGMPIHVSPKDAHFLAGFNTTIDNSTAGK